MIRPILACEGPYAAAEKFVSAGWKLDFSQPPESGDPLVGVSLFGNSVLLGVTGGMWRITKSRILAAASRSILPCRQRYLTRYMKTMPAYARPASGCSRGASAHLR